MALQQVEIDQIIMQLRPQLTLWLAERGTEKTSMLYEMELRERIVRVEEELKHQRELMQQSFELMKKQIEQVDKRLELVDKRLEQVDKKFETMTEHMDKRFEAMTLRIDRFMFWSFGITITASGMVITVLKLWH